MKEKLTKFQTTTWEKIQPIIKQIPYTLELNFDGELILTQTLESTEYITTIFQKNEISLLQKKENGKIDLTFFSEDGTEKYIELISKIFK